MKNFAEGFLMEFFKQTTEEFLEKPKSGMMYSEIEASAIVDYALWLDANLSNNSGVWELIPYSKRVMK